MTRTLSVEKREAIRVAYEETSESVRSIADRFGYFSTASIHQLINRFGWKPRGNSVTRQRAAHFQAKIGPGTAGRTWRAPELLAQRQEATLAAAPPTQPFPSGLIARHEYYNRAMDDLLGLRNGYWDGKRWCHSPASA